MITLAKAVVKQMSAHKLANNRVINNIGLGVGLYRRFHITQRKPLYEDMSSRFREDKPCEADARYVTQEMFSNMNTQHLNRFSAVEKDLVKCHLAVNRLETKLHQGFLDMEGKISRAVGLRHWAQEKLESVVEFICIMIAVPVIGVFILCEVCIVLDVLGIRGKANGGSNDNNDNNKKQ